MPQKILIIADFESNGGTKTYFNSLVSYVNGKTSKSQYLLLKKNSNLSKEEIQFLSNNYKVLYLPSFYTHNNTNKFPLFFFLYRTVLSMILYIKFDEIIITTGNYFHFINILFFKKRNIYYILHTYPPYSIKKSLKYYLLKIYFKLLDSSNNNFITVSEFSKKNIINYTGFLKTKINVIYNYVTIQKTTLIDNNKNNIVLTVGHVESWKNPDYWLSVAIESCKYQSDLKFIWVGAGSLRNTMIDKTPLEFKNKILWINETTQINDYYENALIYFQPSKIESFGLAVLEALSFGLPCIVGNNGGLTEIIINNVNGFIDNLEDTNYTVDIINTLLTNKSIYNNIKLAAFETVNNKFSSSIWETKMNKIFNFE